MPDLAVAHGLKDLLQAELTPYEILEVTRAASGPDIQKAFALGIGKRKNVQKLTLAQRVLQNPAERAVTDLFHYLPEWAGRLSPSVISQAAILDVAQRGATAEAWAKQLKAGFPDLAAVHSLAVLWYWWAIWSEEQQSQAKDGTQIFGMWQKAIAYWVMFLVNEEFWSGKGITREIETQVNAIVIKRLTGHFQDRGQKAKGDGSLDLAKHYRELELALTHELRTARLVSSAGIRTANGKVVCGVLTLQQFGLLETVRKQVDLRLQRSPSNDNLKKLLEAISPNSAISALITDQRPQDAISAIDEKERAAIDVIVRSYDLHRAKSETTNDLREKAQKEFRATPEGKELEALRARALHFLAKQQASLNRLEDALGTWERALNCQPAATLKTTIISDLVNSCQTGAAAMQQHRPDAAIGLLERAVRLTDDSKLKLLLAEQLTTRAIRTINEATKRAGTDGTEDTARVKAEIKRGMDDLQRAVDLGSKRAGEQLEEARKMYEAFAFGSISREAHEAAERGDWDTAIRLLRTAITSVSGEAATTLKQNLAVCLCNRAMDGADRALKKPNPMSAKLNEMFAQLALASYKVGCALCYTSFRDSSYSVNLPAGGTAHVCPACASKLQSAIADASKPNPATLAALRSAEKDLAESVVLDPSNDQATNNLEELRKVLSQVERGGALRGPGQQRYAEHEQRGNYSGPLFETQGDVASQRNSVDLRAPIARKTNFKFWAAFWNSFSRTGWLMGGSFWCVFFLAGHVPDWLFGTLLTVWAAGCVYLIYWCIKDEYDKS